MSDYASIGRAIDEAYWRATREPRTEIVKKKKGSTSRQAIYAGGDQECLRKKKGL